MKVSEVFQATAAGTEINVWIVPYESEECAEFEYLGSFVSRDLSRLPHYVACANIVVSGLEAVDSHINVFATYKK